MVAVRLGGSVVALAVVGLITSACSSSGGDSGDGGGATGGVGVATESRPRTVNRAGGQGSTYDSGVLAQVGSAQQRVIKTANLELEVPRGEFRSSVEDVIALAQQLDGVVQSTSIDDTSRRMGMIQIRVPSNVFESALAQLDAIGDIKSEHIEGEDVGEEFVDLQARLRNGRAQERVLLRLMDRATSVADTIRVQRQLERVQQGIEQLKGRLRFLEDRTSLSTITIDLREAGAEPARVSTLGRAWREAVDGFFAVVSAIVVALGFALPLALLALLVVLVFRRVRPRLEAE